MKIGYLGLGNMGSPMAINLARAGCDIEVFDLDEAKMSAPVEHGAKPAQSGHSLAARADILFTSLPQPHHVEAALPNLLDAMASGSIWVDLTTNNRDLIIRLAEHASDRGIGSVDAPVTGAVDGARLGKLTFFVGGNAEHIEKVTPLLRIMGTPIVCGDLGTGNVVKLITNQIWFINAIALGEALVLGKKSGINLAVVWEALKNSVGDTFVARHDAPSIFAGHYDPSFSLALCCKDLRLLAKLSEDNGCQTDMTTLARAKFEEARSRFGDDAAELLVCKLTEEASGTNLRMDGDWIKHWEV